MSSDGGVAATTPTETGGTRRVAARVQAALVGILLVAFLVQMLLAGLGAFRGTEATRVKDSFYEPHRALGFAMAGVTLLILVVALVARTGSRGVVLAAVLAVLTAVLQPALAGLADDGAWIGGLHALSGLAIGGVAGALMRVTRTYLAGAPTTT